MRLTSFSPTPGYLGFDLYRYADLIRAVQNCCHPFDLCRFQPGLCLCYLLGAALDKHLIMAHEDRHGS